MANSETTQALPGQVVPIVGAVTLAEVTRHRETIVAALASGADVRLDLGESGPWDLAGLQLLLSAARTGEGRITLEGVPGMLRAVADRASARGVLDGLAAGSAGGT